MAVAEAVCIADPGELPAGAVLALYGAGGRGAAMLRDIRARRPDIRVVGWIDTYKRGSFLDLPVWRLDAFLAVRQTRPEVAILVTSAFYPTILRTLAAHGIEGCLVAVEPGDQPFVAATAPEGVAPLLDRGRHPLGRAPRDTRRTGPAGDCWRCPELSDVYLRPTGLSFCCWLPDLAFVEADADAALDRLDRLRGMFRAAIDAGRHAYCAACPGLGRGARDGAPGRVRALHIDTTTVCNLDCAYCIVKNTPQAVEYDPLAVIEGILASDRLAPSFSFDWGGFGEPTLNKDFAALTERLIARGGKGLVYSNCLVHSPAVERHLGASLTVVCSLDAGTRETYAALRRRDGHDRVWDNIGRYLAAAGPDHFIAKYIMLPQNSGQADLEGFVARCRAAGVRHVLLARDFYEPDFAPEIASGLARLQAACLRAGLTVKFLATAVSPDEAARVTALAATL